MEPVMEPGSMLGGTLISLLLILLVPLGFTFMLLRVVNRLAFATAVGTAFLFVLVSGAFILGRANSVSAGSPNRDLTHLALIISAVLLPTLGCYLLMIYQKWTGTPPHKADASFASWLKPGYLLWAAGLAWALAMWAEVPPLLGAGLLVGLLASYPLIYAVNLPAATNADSPAPNYDSLTAEREKVLTMVAERQITPEEGAELLNALGSTRQASSASPRAPLPRHARLAVVGSLLVLVGFFLPWFVINPGKELGRATQSLGMQVNMPAMPADLQQQLGSMGNMVKIKTADLEVTGPRVGHSLGWLILLLAGIVAAAHGMRDQFDASTRRTIALSALAIGCFLLAYLLSDTLRYASFGIAMVLAGYACLAIATLRPVHPGAAAA